MALSYQIEQAGHNGATKPLAKFTDETIVPNTLRECASSSANLGDALRYLHRMTPDHGDLVILMDIILGEG